MTTAYPAALDSATDPLPTTSQLEQSHAAAHANLNAAVAALQEKLGVDGSDDPDSVDYKLATGTGGFQLDAAVAAVLREMRAKVGERVSVDDFGAIGDGTSHPVSEWVSSGRFANLTAIQAAYPHVIGLTDEIDYAAIQAAINHVEACNGGVVDFGRGNREFLVNRDLYVDDHNVFLQGCARQKHANVGNVGAARWTQYGGTVIRWNGPAGGGHTVLTFAPPATGPLLQGCGMDGILIDGAGIADYGLKVLSNQRGRFGSNFVADCVVRNWTFDVMPSAGWTSADPRDNQCITVDELHSRNYLTAAQNGEGVYVGGDSTANTSRCRFGFINIIHWNGSGLRVKSADGIRFDTVLAGRSGGTGPGVRIEGDASAATNLARSISFGFVEAGPGGMELVTNTYKPFAINVECYSLNNGTPAPTVGVGCQVNYGIDTGAQRVYSSTAQALDTLVREINTISSIIGARQFNARNSADAMKTYAAILGFIVDNTAGSEDGRLYFQNLLAGVATNVGYIGAGMVLGAPTGGDKGQGTLNLAGNGGQFLSFNGGPGSFVGTGSPEGVVTAPVGSDYRNLSGGASTTLYIKTSGAGNTGWTAK